MKCPHCREEIKVTIFTPNTAGAWSRLQIAKEILSQWPEGAAKQKLWKNLDEAMELLNANLDIRFSTE